MEKNLEKIKKEIDEFGFSIFEVPDEIRKKYFLGFKNKLIIISFKKIKNSLIFIFKFSFFIVLLYLIFFIISFIPIYLTGKDFNFLFEVFYLFGKVLIFIFFTIFFLLFFILSLYFFIYFFFGFIENLFHFSNDHSYENIDGIKSKYIIFTEKNIFFDEKAFDLSFLNLENFFEKYLKNEEKEILEISDVDLKILEKIILIFNKNQRKIYFLNKNFGKIKENISNLKEKQKNLENLFSEDKEKIFLRFVEIEKNIKNIGKIVEESLIYKEKVKKSLKNLGKKDFINFEKYDLWLKNNLLLPLKNMKNILENHKNFTEKLLGENKNNNSEQIIILNKRLELQRETLAKNILILDEKISKLEK